MGATMNKIQITAVIISLLALVMSLVSLGKMLYDIGYDRGFDACIEENNLYERYGNNETISD